MWFVLLTYFLVIFATCIHNQLIYIMSVKKSPAHRDQLYCGAHNFPHEIASKRKIALKCETERTGIIFNSFAAFAKTAGLFTDL